ncbi:CDP-alcohol phosphatidyltransferase family protein [Wenzhouxiangella sp. EGI_FJ10409]|uniref:CDP-alcohol phosphatidyltransferase family protein n=1 Tax=Wenzhouxiangella sp. EGI_FJ10409 TaxID=3243767 RepID=UPI0035DECD4F
MRTPIILTDLAGGALVTAAFTFFLAGIPAATTSLLAAALLAYALLWAILFLATTDRLRLGWADRVTLVRATIVCALAGALLDPGLYVERAGWIVGLTLAALAADGLDGWVARRLAATSDFGARFDMETDAALILVLCAGLWLSGQAPAWVLAIGLMRPVFVAAGLAWPWLSQPLPERWRRKLVCVVQVGALPVALLPFLPDALRLTLLAAALLALGISFAIDIRWLYRKRKTTGPSPRRAT